MLVRRCPGALASRCARKFYQFWKEIKPKRSMMRARGADRRLALFVAGMESSSAAKASAARREVTLRNDFSRTSDSRRQVVKSYWRHSSAFPTVAGLNRDLRRRRRRRHHYIHPPGSGEFRTGFAVSGNSGSGWQIGRGGEIRSRRPRSAQSRRESYSAFSGATAGTLVTWRPRAESVAHALASEDARRDRRSAEMDTCWRARTNSPRARKVNASSSDTLIIA